MASRTAFRLRAYFVSAAFGILFLDSMAWADPLEGGKVVPLWPKGAPGALGEESADVPTLTIFSPDPNRATKTGIVVCPGGGYQGLALGHEGREVADWLTERGITTFVLKYRLAPKYQHPIPKQDVLRAMRWVRANAEAYGLDPSSIGIWGFSAGGHLASTAATQWDEGNLQAEDPIERANSRPDFAILAYPVISMESSVTHAGSRRNLLGENPSPALVREMSNETRVTSRTPPTFLFHTNEDGPVPAENSIRYFLALRAQEVPVELHVYERGVHGVGLARKDPALATWTTHLERWLERHGGLNLSESQPKSEVQSGAGGP